MALTAHTVVLGAGLVGSSTAMHLAELGHKDILVLDVDLFGSFSSSELNAGGVRATWNHPINAALSKISIDYFETVKKEVGFLQKGYFWMYSKDQWPAAKAALGRNENLKKLGIEYLDPEAIQKRHSFINKHENLGGATFSPKDGLLNPNLLKLHFRDKAKNLGVQFVDRLWVESVDVLEKSVTLKARKIPTSLSDDDLKEILCFQKNLNDFELVEIKADILVNCSGAWAKKINELLRNKNHSHAVRRQVSFFDCKDVDIRDCGMFVDVSGVYFHPEGPNILAGFALESEPHGYNLDYDGESFFNEYIWTPLYDRSTGFENLKHLTGWGGLYEVSEDRCAIIGPVGQHRHVFEAHSFSGRGAMQAYGAGKALAERIHFGEYRTLNLNCLAASRFERGELVREDLLI